ncbi:MAG: hypothetical protein OXC62_05885 [Aestuariivita sp.]|nr:hypothetical protein [Aestuariivita sp.]
MGCFNLVNIIPIEAKPFEDFVDGYFPLAVTLAHLLERRRFESALMVIRVAPIMDIPNLESMAPVPLHINPRYSGQIDWLVAAVHRPQPRLSAVISGWAQWHWNDILRGKVSRLPYSLRLAEPAYVRGVGFYPGNLHTCSLGYVRPVNTSSSVAVSTPNANPSDSSVNIEQFDTAECLCWNLNQKHFLEWFDRTTVQPWGCPYTPNVNNGSTELLLIEQRCADTWDAFISDTKAFT